MSVETKVIKVYESFVLGKCHCGRCNVDIEIRTVWGFLKQFARGHSKEVKKYCIECSREYRPLRKGRCKNCYRKWLVRKAPKRKCICDPRCQVMIPNIRYDGKPNYYADGHNTRGEKHHNWKGGVQKDKEYLVEYDPYHPKATIHGTVRQHRRVYERYYNCCLLPFTEIHHKNGNKKDNRIENLQPVYNYQHTSIHHPKVDKSDRRCSDPECPHPDKTSDDKWYNNGKNGYLCHNCYQKKNSYKRRKDYKNRNK